MGASISGGVSSAYDVKRQGRQMTIFHCDLGNRIFNELDGGQVLQWSGITNN
jgi:hypothetical protein